MTTTTKSSETKSFTDRMREQLTDVKASVNGTLANIEATGSRASADLRAKREAAQAGMEARSKHIESANSKMKTGLDAKKAAFDTAVADWKDKRDLERLEDQAQGAEEYATATMMFAWGAVEEANAAILDAVVARADAEEAKVLATIA